MSAAGAKKPRVANDYEVAVEELDRASEAISTARDFLFAELDFGARARRVLERFKYTAPGLTNAELALLERFVTELEGP